MRRGTSFGVVRRKTVRAGSLLPISIVHLLGYLPIVSVLFLVPQQNAIAAPKPKSAPVALHTVAGEPSAVCAIYFEKEKLLPLLTSTGEGKLFGKLFWNKAEISAKISGLNRSKSSPAKVGEKRSLKVFTTLKRELAACSRKARSPGVFPFSPHVSGILSKRCLVCHNTWTNDTKFYRSSGLVSPGELAKSPLYAYLSGNPERFTPATMPKGSKSLSEVQLMIIASWINSLAKAPPIQDPSEDDPGPIAPDAPTPDPNREIGSSLYASNCSSCHGALRTSTKQGRSAQAISEAIELQPMMVNLKTILSEFQVQLIALALSSPPPTNTPGPSPTPTPVGAGPTSTPTPSPEIRRGQEAWAAHCSGCHGSITSTDKRGVSAQQIIVAIDQRPQMMALKGILTPEQIDLIALALAAPPPEGPTPSPTPGDQTPTPTPTPCVGSTCPSPKTDIQKGREAWGAYCASCHGSIEVTTKIGASAQNITDAIKNQTTMANLAKVVTAEDIRLIAKALNAPKNPRATSAALVLGTSKYLESVYSTIFLPDDPATFTAADDLIKSRIAATFSVIGSSPTFGGRCERFDTNCPSDARLGNMEPPSDPTRAASEINLCELFLGGSGFPVGRPLQNLLAKIGRTATGPVDGAEIQGIYSLFYPGRTLPTDVAQAIRENLYSVSGPSDAVRHAMAAHLICTSLSWDGM